MKTRKVFYALLVICSMHIGLMAQQAPASQPRMTKEQRQEKMEKFKAMKVEYITTQLDLTPEEAEKFWPIYNEFMEQIHALEIDRKKAMREARKKETVSDVEIERLIALNFDTDQKILDLRRKYDTRFRKVLSIQKVGKLYRAEEEFKREVMRKLKGHPAQAPRP